MTQFIVCDPSGKIRRVGFCPDDAVHLQSQSDIETVHIIDIPDCSTATHYWDGQQVVKRPSWDLPASIRIPADGETEEIIPLPTDVVVEAIVFRPEGEAIMLSITDGSLNFSTEIPGEYRISFDMFPYPQQRVDIHAV